MVACPSISDTIFGFTLRVRSSVAHVCRRSWKRILRQPGTLQQGLERTPGEVVAVEGFARLGGEYQATRPKCTGYPGPSGGSVPAVAGGCR
jgi:hypothetical protein